MNDTSVIATAEDGASSRQGEGPSSTPASTIWRRTRMGLIVAAAVYAAVSGCLWAGATLVGLSAQEGNTSPVPHDALKRAELAEPLMPTALSTPQPNEWATHEIDSFRSVCLAARRGSALRIFYSVTGPLSWNSQFSSWSSIRDSWPHFLPGYPDVNWGPWQPLLEGSPTYQRPFGIGPSIYFSMRWPTALDRDDHSAPAQFADHLLAFDKAGAQALIDSMPDTFNDEFSELRNTLVAGALGTISLLEHPEGVVRNVFVGSRYKATTVLKGRADTAGFCAWTAPQHIGSTADRSS